MPTRRIAALALSGALIAGGTGVAIAAGAKDDDKQAEQAVLDDAAERLDVTPQKLRDALAAAQDAQLDQAAKDGDLTQNQADAIKRARKQAGTVLSPGLRDGASGIGVHGRPMLHGGLHPFGVRGDIFEDFAKALGTTPDRLKEQLRDGTSLADVAKVNGKSMAGMRAAGKAAMKTRLDKAVRDGDLTQQRADEILDNVEDKVAAIGSAKGLRLRGRGEHHRFGPKPPPGAPRPGAFVPGEQGAPDIVLPHGVIS